MRVPDLHVIGLGHTRTSSHFSHCAFTGKVMRMSPMMRSVGYRTFHYGVGNPAESGASVNVELLSDQEQFDLLGSDPLDKSRKYAFDNVRVDTPLYTKFNTRLIEELKFRVQPGDLVLHTFGNASALVSGTHKGIDVESGIGYDDPWCAWQIFESHAKYHEVLGRHRKMPSYYTWVIPNYFDPSDWTVRSEHGEYVLFLGRISHAKGLNTMVEMARTRPDVRFIICGQGDPQPFLQYPNIEYQPPVHGKDRDELLGKARCVICPSAYVEPFGGVVVEAMMTGTPVLVPPWGAFMETVVSGRDGFHCRVLSDWSRGIDAVLGLDRDVISHRARSQYSMYNLAKEYDYAFKMIHGVHEIPTRDWSSFPGRV